MKKFLSIASLFALILSVSIFTSCSEPKPYTGKYYNTEFVPNISDSEYTANWVNTNWETRSTHLATWPSKSGYEKKTELKDYELSSYLQSKMLITDEEVQKNLLEMETEGWSYNFYNITGGTLGDKHNILYLTIAE